MAWDFAAQIHSLSGFDADNAGTSSVGGETYQAMATKWLLLAAQEIIHLLPLSLLERASGITYTDQNMNDGDGYPIEGRIISVFRANNPTSFAAASPEQIYECRRIPYTKSFRAADPESLEHATPTDPVYYLEPQSDLSAAQLHILPKDTSRNLSKLTTITPVVAYDSTAITNFPDEAEHLVAIRASIYAAEYQLSIEEDTELYLPMIQNLKQDYEMGLQKLGVMQAQPQQEGR